MHAMPNFGIRSRTAGPEREGPVLNWRRGMFRVWLVMSAGWIMGWSIYLLMEGMGGGISTREEWMIVPVVLFAPPIALGLFGTATIWALRGFVE
jgi:hypothetical protein